MSYSKIINVIDIGSTKITTLAAQYFPEEEKTNIIGVSSIPARGIRRGQVVNIEEATESIIKSVEEAERMAGTPINKASIGITAPHVVSINSSGVVAVSEPNKEINDQDVERVIESAKAISLPAATEIIHVTPRQFIVDGQEGIIDPTGMTGVRLEVETNIIIASSPALKNLRRCINEAGVDILRIAYSGLAAGKSTLSETEKELGVILIDIGGTITSVTIFIESSPCFARVIPVGSKNVTNDLAVGLRLPLEDAEKLKLFLGKKTKKNEKGEKSKDEIDLFKNSISPQEGKTISREVAVNGIMKARIEEIFNLLKEEIKESGYGGATPAGAIITGGGSELINCEKICQQTLGIPAKIGQPKEVTGLVEEIMTPAYASALGLIDYALDKEEGEGQKNSFEGIFQLVKSIQFNKNFKQIGEKIKSLLP